MAWLSSDAQRIPVLVNATATGSSPNDVQFVIPATHERFWSTIDSNGYQLRVTDADGYTALTYQITGWNYANRTATVEVDNVPFTPNTHHVIWLYYGDTNWGNGAGSFTPSSVINGFIRTEQPTTIAATRRPAVGSAVSALSVAKDPAETRLVYIPLTTLAQSCAGAYEGSLRLDEVAGFDFTVEDGGAEQAGMVDDTNCGLIECEEVTYARVVVKGGTTATVYIGRLLVQSALGRIDLYTFEIQVYKIAESA